MAAVLAATYPDLFTGLAVHSGLAYRSATNLPAALEAMARGRAPPRRRPTTTRGRFPSIVIHGTADTTVAPVNADQVLQQSIAASRRCAPDTHDLDAARPTTTTRDREDGGHPYTRRRWAARDGTVAHQLLTVDGLGHAWSGGTAGAPHTDPRGPDATEAIWRFFTRGVAPGLRAVVPDQRRVSRSISGRSSAGIAPSCTVTVRVRPPRVTRSSY